jgi:ribonuclease-3
MLGSSGPDHKKEFEIAIILDDKIISKAKGKSKKEAQQKAAEIALHELKALKEVKK